MAFRVDAARSGSTWKAPRTRTILLRPRMIYDISVTAIDGTTRVQYAQ